jgi:hypothetical protein
VTIEKGAVLVACPNYAGKEYALGAWVDGFHGLDYEPKYAYMVDNTSVSMGFFELIRSVGISASHLTPYPGWDRTFKRCWDLIAERARELDCYWVLSMEADNVVAPEGLAIMVDMALAGNCHLVTHSYPMHRSAAEASGVDPETFYYNELGCMLMSRRLLERALDEYDEYGQMVVAIEATNDRYMGGRIKLTRRFEVQHLDGYEMAFQNLGPSEYPGLMYPGERMPDDIGTAVPPSLRFEGVPAPETALPDDTGSLVPVSLL